MAKPLSLTHRSLLFLRPIASPAPSLSVPNAAAAAALALSSSPVHSALAHFFSTTSTPYPLQYDLIVNRPAQSSLARTRPRLGGPGGPETSPEPDGPEKPDVDVELGFDDWADRKLAPEADSGMDKSKRKYYSKRLKRMYGSDSEDERRRSEAEGGFVELRPEVVEFHRLHKREEELYFHDAFAYPWEKDKHYKMVYQLEKKYFPEHCLDKAFLEPGESGGPRRNAGAKGKKDERRANVGEEKMEDKRLVFFEGEKKDGDDLARDEGKKDVMEKKVEEFFKCLKKVPSEKNVASDGEPYVLTRSTELPPIWDGPYGTVVLINKPKGWTSFTVCGKLRRLVKVKKVGHAGTLDPMATGLLIVCVGKATKLVETYQGMVKGYSGVFRLGEATSTLDADSPIIQREPWEHIKDEDIKKTAASFLGEIWQVPPMFSAIKVGGEKMYEKARRGETVELSPRRISILKFDIERSLEDRQNLIFRVTCSKGTYIRSLCADFGKTLGSCAHLTALRRDSIGQYSADDAWDFKDLEEAITKGYF
ncbi:uncharacterized protein LOC115670502 isoform X1 [Syzygium oleosum]|uniref:uncharacterized protein LOC115670502 isoform X1 n=2 Tax=Syzygium oleosum TaxID=219896 RepID=UPI0011D21F4C|nr:uncharacterized protein LOC115670502 isoform X1 [Syzygium oleosum]